MAETEKLARLNIPLRNETRRELQEVADLLQVSAADAARIAITRLYAQRQQLLGDAA